MHEVIQYFAHSWNGNTARVELLIDVAIGSCEFYGSFFRRGRSELGKVDMSRDEVYQNDCDLDSDGDSGWPPEQHFGL